MPINPNIALGVQPVQQPNLLAQYGQMMALRAAQQETEGYEGVKSAIAGGMNAADPRMLQYGKRGIEAFKAAGEGAVKQQELLAKSFENNLAGIGSVRTPEDLINYSVGQLADPYVGPWLKARGITAEKLTENLQKEIATSGFDAALKKSSMKMVDFYKDQTSIENNKRTTAASYYSSNVSRANNQDTVNMQRERLRDEQQRGKAVPGDNKFLREDIYGNLFEIPTYGNQFGPNARAPAMPPAAANAFVTTPQTSVNSLLNQTTQPQADQTGAPTRANAAAMDARMNTPRPQARAGYQYNDQGQQVKIPQVGPPDGIKLKQGERWNEEKGTVEQIPGSTAYIDQQKKHSSDLNAVKSVQSTTKWGTDRINKILSPENKAGFENNFGGFSAYATKEFSGNTALVKSELDSLKSDLKAKGLQLFRAGGSIGALTEKEWPILESLIATLTPKLDVNDARDVLTTISQKFEALERLAEENYNNQWKETQYFKPVNKSAGGGGGAASSGVIDFGSLK